MKERVYHLLNLKVSETGHVFDLLRIQLFIGIAHSFTNIAAFTFFIYRFSIQGLPYAYLAVAATLLVMNLMYEKLEHKLSPLKLLRLIVVFSGFISLLFWSGFLVGKDNVLIFLLLVWSILFYMVTGYAYWGLVSLLFNVRESKRVFSIVGAGDIPAKLIGYLSAPLLIPFIGLNHLLAFGLVSLGFGLFFINKLIRKEHSGSFKIKHHSHHHHANQTKKAGNSFLNLKENFFFRHKLIFTISLVSLLSYNVFNLVDYTFISQIKQRFHDIAQLASFIAIFFALGRVVALILKLVFTSRVIEKVGVIASLLIMPAILFIFSLAFMAVNTWSGYSLYFFGIMALFTEVLRSTIQEPAFFILFQPLNEQHRLKGHIIAKGYMLAPSLLIVGASLIAMNKFQIELSILFTIKVLLINLCLWAVIVYFIKKEYISTLHRSIARGVFSGDDIHIYDPRTIDILLDKIKSADEKENIYALRLLESGNYKDLDHLFHDCLDTDKAEVKKYVINKLEERDQLTVPLLNHLLETEKDEELREKLISELCRLNPAYLKEEAEKISILDYSTRKSIIVQLLNQSEFAYLYKAGNEINNLLRSQVASERELALDIISELKNIKFTDAIETLMEDPEPAVRRNALIAACKLRTKNLLPFIFTTLAQPANRYMVLQGLFQYGDVLFEDISEVPDDQRERNKSDLIRIAGKVKGPASTRFLLASLSEFQFQEKTINALWSKGFEAERTEDIFLFNQLLKKCLNNGLEKRELYSSLYTSPEHKLIRESLYAEIKNDLLTCLKTCAILYHKKEINRILELIENADEKRIYNAMEMLELVLPNKSSRQINELMDFVLDPSISRKKMALLDKRSIYHKITDSHTDMFNHWTKAVCLYTAFKNKETDFLEAIRENDHDSLIVAETKKFILKSKQQSVYADY